MKRSLNNILLSVSSSSLKECEEACSESDSCSAFAFQKSTSTCRLGSATDVPRANVFINKFDDDSWHVVLKGGQFRWREGVSVRRSQELSLRQEIRLIFT